MSVERKFKRTLEGYLPISLFGEEKRSAEFGKRGAEGEIQRRPQFVSRHGLVALPKRLGNGEKPTLD
jgi:hypothetical protein